MIPKIVVGLSVPVVNEHGDFLTVYSHAYALVNVNLFITRN